MPPPRTRGSTLRCCGRLYYQLASPAYAGIDPTRPDRDPDHASLPRVRGDRPGSAIIISKCGAPPPRTRGSTPVSCSLMFTETASPAYAGIDPTVHPHRHSTARLPRVRGDRPTAADSDPRLSVPPPRTRGSTRCRSCGLLIGTASPAYAGIDPPFVPAHRCRHSLPRVRGDRPVSQIVINDLRMPPPRTRGSTRPMSRKRRRQEASPAYAGIDPLQPIACQVVQRLPRVRGDRPLRPRLPPMLKKPPPRTRGSTPKNSRSHLQAHASPAYAGIDPHPGRRLPGSACLPRVRGDRPSTEET